MRLLTSLLLFAAALAARPALAQPAPPIRLTVDEAIARGLARAPGVAEATARETAAEATADARAALRSPTLTASSSYLRTNHIEEFAIPLPGQGSRVIFPDIPSNYRVRMEASVPLYLGGRDEALEASALAEARAAAGDRRAVEAELRLAITTAYWNLVTSRETVAVRERALARTDAWVDDVGSRVEAGLLPPNDVLSARAERARQRVRLIEARSAAAVAEADLGQLIGAGPDARIETVSAVEEPDPAAADLAAMSAEAMLAAAQARRGERDALLERAEALRASARGAEAARRPQIAALAAVEPARPNNRFVPRTDEWNTSWDLGVNVTWSLWDGGRARAERAATLAQAAGVGERLREFDDRLGVEVRRRRLDLEAAQAALGASAEGVTAATEARRVVLERFAVGVATSTDVLDAEVALLEAELERTRLQAALRFAEARLVRTLGGS